ncbi:MAG: TetR/AcrR family transcriptional regulator [Pseudomonadota bacterium]
MARPALKPRKSPKQARSSETVEAIVEAAARILEVKGVEGFNTNAVALRAGVSIGSLYQYFPNKHALIAELLRRSVASLRDGVTQAAQLAQGAPLREGMRLLIRAAVDHQLARPMLEKLLDYQEARLPMDTQRRAIAEDLQAQLVNFLNHHRGAVSVSDLTVAALDSQAIARALIDAAAERDETDARLIERRVLAAVMGYLTAPPQRGD